MMSTYHDPTEMWSGEGRPGTSQQKDLPLMAEAYRKRMQGVDRASQLRDKFTTRQRTTVWPIRAFYSMLDQCTANAFVLHRGLIRRVNMRKMHEWFAACDDLLSAPRHEMGGARWYRRMPHARGIGVTEAGVGAERDVRVANLIAARHAAEEIKSEAASLGVTLPSSPEMRTEPNHRAWLGALWKVFSGSAQSKNLTREVRELYAMLAYSAESQPDEPSNPSVAMAGRGQRYGARFREYVESCNHNLRAWSKGERRELYGRFFAQECVTHREYFGKPSRCNTYCPRCAWTLCHSCVEHIRRERTSPEQEEEEAERLQAEWREMCITFGPSASAPSESATDTDSD